MRLGDDGKGRKRDEKKQNSLKKKVRGIWGKGSSSENVLGKKAKGKLRACCWL